MNTKRNSPWLNCHSRLDRSLVAISELIRIALHHTRIFEIFHLILHKAFDRIDDKRQTGAQQRWQLKRDGFPCACRQEADDIFSPKHAIDYGELARAKFSLLKKVLEKIFGDSVSGEAAWQWNAVLATAGRRTHSAVALSAE